LAWFNSYLSNRSFQVKIGDGLSEVHKLVFGVPQGSVLGPLLFSCYTQPLAKIMSDHSLSAHLFADDTQNWRAFKLTSLSSLPGVVGRVEVCLREVRQWMGVNKLKLNDLKTEFLLLMSQFQKHLRPDNVSIKIGDAIIVPTSSARNLGFIFDHQMSFHKHISQVVSAGHFHLRKIASIKKYIPSDLLTTLVHAFITSRLDFCNALYYGLPSYEIDRLQKLQNQAARLVTNTKKRDHITPVLRELHWLPVQARIIFKILTFAFRAVRGTGPAYLRLPVVQSRRQTRAGAAPQLTYVMSRTKSAGDRAYSVSAPRLWNDLPVHLRSHTELASFKRSLKTHLFTLFYK